MASSKGSPKFSETPSTTLLRGTGSSTVPTWYFPPMHNSQPQEQGPVSPRSLTPARVQADARKTSRLALPKCAALMLQHSLCKKNQRQVAHVDVHGGARAQANVGLGA